MAETNASESQKSRSLLLDLAGLYPACFDWKKPQPLKIGLFDDLVAVGHDPQQVRHALAIYCSRARYLKSLRPDAPRIDLQGQPAGIVTAEASEHAKARLENKWNPPAKTTAPVPELPIDAPLTEDNIVPGRLELTVKFSEIPKPMPVKSGMKIGIQTESALVVATLPPKAWKKLEKAKADWPQWVASLTGKLGTRVGADGPDVVVLENPAIQVFEKKTK
ncbi:ProQ/FinO family protein [Allochromatium humboldtianum]|uniref:ProQ/FinO family protein n=1 Tax=Allochromatium humboldtianum TaxID=504901 RepID=A0A850RC97_9GAMM|nr:ProQ/FinO family protein [Allochromatium humboldtianum]NVZ11664.1 ProQ/FinO family protein [Allochromatium humboldtianum]